MFATELNIAGKHSKPAANHSDSVISLEFSVMNAKFEKKRSSTDVNLLCQLIDLSVFLLLFELVGLNKHGLTLLCRFCWKQKFPPFISLHCFWYTTSNFDVFFSFINNKVVVTRNEMSREIFFLCKQSTI